MSLLKAAREKCGLSQRKLAVQASVPQTTISRIEYNNIRPTPEVAEKLVTCLNGYVTELQLLYPNRFQIKEVKQSSRPAKKAKKKAA